MDSAIGGMSDLHVAGLLIDWKLHEPEVLVKVGEVLEPPPVGVLTNQGRHHLNMNDAVKNLEYTESMNPVVIVAGVVEARGIPVDRATEFFTVRD